MSVLSVIKILLSASMNAATIVVIAQFYGLFSKLRAIEKRIMEAEIRNE